jgi:SWI/SNF-related matrix-associated actin-dependent regulator 1 of chromatin subfamily A
MSGTPMPNHAGELHAILYALFPDVIRKTDGRVMKQIDFEDAYCIVENRWFTRARPTRVVTGSKNLEDLRARLGPHVVRRKKKDVLKELPDMTFDTYPVPVDDVSLVWVEPDDWHDLTDDEKLERIQASEEHIMRKRHQLGVAKLNGSIEAIVDALEGSNRKVLVFAHHADVIDGLVRGLGDYNPVKIDGGTKLKDREDAVDLFLNNPTTRVFIGNTLAAGTSITLIGPKNECSDVFFVEADWSPGNNIQAASRVHRIGQKDAVQVWFLTADGTLDDVIQDILARKTRDFQLLFG